ncbi:MAG: 50S ribosomal protein L3, partial [Candidatus Nanoarchaeia archaeon]
MPTTKSPRKGSLQFWPRKRAKKFLPRVNWATINSNKQLKGFICYKAGMASAIVKDNTPNSMTKDKRISIPVTIIECPSMKIYSIRLYKNKKVAKDILAENIDKELKRKLKTPRSQKKPDLEAVKHEDYDDVKIIVYSIVKKTNIKKKPDVVEIGISGSSIEEKLKFIKENISKEISVTDFFENGEIVDFRGLTTGR